MKQQKTLNWYIVIWRNPAFVRTRYKPQAVGTIEGIEGRRTNNERLGLNAKARDYQRENRYKFLMRGTGKQLKAFLETGVWK